MKYLNVSLIALSVLTAVVLGGCKCVEKVGKAADLAAQAEVIPQAAVQPAQYIPKATVFKMSGDYADHVAVTLGADGNLVYYPAPTDLTDASMPVAIGEGWWLNRQGLSEGSVFTKWTFAEYRALKSAPTPAEIKAAIIPDAYVTEMRRLPLNINQAREASPASLLQYLK